MRTIEQHYAAIKAAPTCPDAWSPLITEAVIKVGKLKALPKHDVSEFVSFWFSDEFHAFGCEPYVSIAARYDIRAWNVQPLIDTLKKYETIRREFAS